MAFTHTFTGVVLCHILMVSVRTLLVRGYEKRFYVYGI